MRHFVIAMMVLLGTASAVAQTSKPSAPRKAAPWLPPRTPDGRPDLQGIWISNSATPLERPKELAGRPLLTDEELADLRKRADRLFKDDNSDSDFAGGDNFFLAPLADVERFRNPNATGGAEDMIERWFEHRTSLIVDPADGRIPWTAEGRQRQAAMGRARLAVAPGSGRADQRCALPHLRCSAPGWELRVGTLQLLPDCADVGLRRDGHGVRPRGAHHSP